jgi:hypothetical protein
MHAISNWRAKRSGPAITIEGRSQRTRRAIKVPHIKLIEARGRTVVALASNGEEYELIFT